MYKTLECKALQMFTLSVFGWYDTGTCIIRRVGDCPAPGASRREKQRVNSTD